MARAVSGLLLVEGKDDQHVVWQICEQYSVLQSFCIQQTEGVEALLTALPERILESGIRRLGIMFDANDAREGRWRRVCQALAGQRYADLPQAPLPVGTIVPTPDADFLPTVGV